MTTGLIIRPMQQLIDAARRLFAPPPDQIEGLDPSKWPSPMQPVQPMGGRDAEPIGWPFNFGQNLIYTPRPDAEYTAAELRWLAMYPLARICIENTKDVVCQMPWRVQLRQKPGETKKQRQQREKNDANIKRVSQLLECPDSEHAWDTWLRPLIEDLMVIDAASILLRATKSGELAQLRVIPGDTIVRYIDENGWTPQPPSPAYAQLWQGIPRVNLTTDQLLYRPRNIVRRNTISSHLYGMSQTEQLAPEIKVGIERLEWVTSFYTKGTIPDGIHVIPDDVGPDKISEYMRSMASELAGNLARRHQLRAVQGFTKDGKDQILFPKEKTQWDAFDEAHVRKICFGYGTSPQRLMRQMNRASAEQADEAAQVEGAEPILRWLKTAVLDYLIQRKLGLVDYEWVADIDREADIVKQMTAMTGYVKEGIRSRAEVKEILGDDPSSDPAASQLMITTGTGAVPLDSFEQQQEADKEAARVSARNGAQPGRADGGEPTNAVGSKPNGSGGKPNGKHAVGFAAGPAAVQQSTLTTGRILIRRTAREGTHAQAKQARFQVGNLTPTAQTARDHVARDVYHVFRKAEQRVAKILSKVRKDALDDLVVRVWREIEAELVTLPPSLERAFADAAQSGGLEGLVQVDVNDADVFTQVNTLAQEWARDRSAELVGMRYDDAGNLVANPSAEFAISETTRSEIRDVITQAFADQETSRGAIARAISDRGVFSEARANMIANTEISRAQAFGNLDAWRASGVVASIDWLTSQDEGVCVECESLAADAPYPIDDVPDFPHPNRRCILAVADLTEES